MIERKRLPLCKVHSCTFTFSLCSGFRCELTYIRSTLAVVVLKLQSRRKAYRTQDGVAVVTTQQLLFILRTIGPQQNTKRNTDEIPGQHILLNINVALVSHVFPFDTLTNPLPYFLIFNRIVAGPVLLLPNTGEGFLPRQFKQSVYLMYLFLKNY